jgi:hypothetical protein
MLANHKLAVLIRFCSGSKSGGIMYGAIQREGAMWSEKKVRGKGIKQNLHSHG